MNDRPGGEVSEEEDAVSEITNRPAVTYTIKVLAEGARGRTVLFRRTVGVETIEIRVETSAPNLLAALPELLVAALETQRALWSPPRAVPGVPGFFPRFAAELRRVRWLTVGGGRGGTDDAPRSRGALRLVGKACRALRKGAPPRGRGRGRGAPRGRERGRRGR